MAIKRTEWRPHTCKCVISYDWNTDDNEDVRKHTVAAHQHCGGNHPHAVMGEILEDSEFLKEYHVREKARVASLPKE